MTQINFAASLTAFACLPVAMLLLRAFGPPWFTGILAFGIVAFVGWFLVNISIQLYFADLGEQMNAYGDNPPRELADAWANDGAKQVCGALFGGFYALIYYAPFALLYEIARLVRRIYRRRQRQASQFPLRDGNFRL